VTITVTVDDKYLDAYNRFVLERGLPAVTDAITDWLKNQELSQFNSDLAVLKSGAAVDAPTKVRLNKKLKDWGA
jgi:hypothetical protein